MIGIIDALVSGLLELFFRIDDRLSKREKEKDAQARDALKKELEAADASRKR